MAKQPLLSIWQEAVLISRAVVEKRKVLSPATNQIPFGHFVDWTIHVDFLYGRASNSTVIFHIFIILHINECIMDFEVRYPFGKILLFSNIICITWKLHVKYRKLFHILHRGLFMSLCLAEVME